MAVSGGTQWLAWIGAALAASPMPVLMGWLMIAPTARTGDNLPLLLFVSTAGTFLAAWETFFEGSAGRLPVVVAATALFIFLLYLFWYSRFGRYSDPRIDVGSKMPAFELADLEGNIVRTSDLVGSPSVFLFYRGNWCPLCMAQIGELVDRYQQMEELGIKVHLISPQSDSHSKALAEKHGVPFHFLVDKDNKVAESLGIAVKNGVPLGIPGGYAPDTVMPTLIVTNAAGTIVFSDQTDNYRVRPEPDIFLAILRRTRAMNS
jgi:peroxiredoxin